MSSLKLTYTVEESGIKNGQLIYVEFLLPTILGQQITLRKKKKIRTKKISTK